ncbi:hypothetical protein GCM10028798_09780 [Humibacter antri]
MSTVNPSPRRRLVTPAYLANYLACTPRTIRNHISRGLYPAYRIPGTRGVRLDLDEVMRAMQMIPTVAPRTLTPFGPNARIVDLSEPQPLRVRAELADVPVEPASQAHEGLASDGSDL